MPAVTASAAPAGSPWRAWRSRPADAYRGSRRRAEPCGAGRGDRRRRETRALRWALRDDGDRPLSAERCRAVAAELARLPPGEPGGGLTQPAHPGGNATETALSVVVTRLQPPGASWVPAPASGRQGASQRTLDARHAHLVAQGHVAGLRLSGPAFLDRLANREPSMPRGVSIAAGAPWVPVELRDWVAERTDHPREVIEAALAHVVPNKVEAAYTRSDMFERRRLLMDDWVAYLGVRVPAERATCRAG